MPKKLAEYQRKRKFHKTPEPKGKTARKGGPLTFIIHLHDATRLHYDLRLEMGGVLKSWAVPKGPSLNPTEQRLAVAVEDHPMEYGKFEGVIPEGNYGAGPVIVWDKGTYHERRAKSRTESESNLKKGLQKGHITFVLDGTKVKGEFALVRMQQSRNWLLIKKGDAFSSYKKVEWDPTSVVSKKTLGNLKKEIAPATWTRAGKSELPRVRVMLPLGKKEVPTGSQWIWNEFGSGERVLAEVQNGEVRLLSRARLPLHRKYPQLAKSLSKIAKSAVLDGEVTDSGEFRVLDLIYWDGEDFREKPLSERMKRLGKLAASKKSGLVLAPTLTKPEASGNWIARKKDSLYQSALSSDWVRPKAAATRRVFLTNPTKKLWPKEGYTKKDLVEYYRAVTSVMLPFLKDRPLSLHRYPNGITSAGFFQKDLSGYLPPGVETFAHYSESSARTIHYAVCQNESTLSYLANLACIEINPWMARTTDIDSPDYCVIDLDPDGNDFEEVIEVALAYKKILDALKVKAFCKTSGATGLHIFIPWKGKTSFDESREFALKLSERILEKFPKQTSMERSPAKRRRKIYLDCFQNSRGQTIVAPYSVRPNPGAPVSTPLEWSELKSKIAPSDFTLKTVPERLQKRQDPWLELFESGNDPAKCLKKLK